MGTGHEEGSPYSLMSILVILCAQALEMKYHYKINCKIYLTSSAVKSLSQFIWMGSEDSPGAICIVY
jgi:hypothetical protein